MSLVQVVPPYPVFADLDGSPLDAGYLYIGFAGQNPETMPIPLYWDQDLTIPASQPVRTVGGYPSRNGSPATLYADGTFSITVKDKRGRLVFYSPVGYAVNPESVAADTSIKTVANNIASVQAVAGDVANINAIVADMGSIDAVAGDLGGVWGQGVTYDFGLITNAPVGVISPPGGNIVIVAQNIADVNAIAAALSDVHAVAGALVPIVLVAGDLTNIDAVAADLAHVDTVATNIASVVTVANNIAAIISVVASALLRANNLSDLLDPAAARTNLGLGSLATKSSVGTSELAATLDYGSIP